MISKVYLIRTSMDDDEYYNNINRIIAKSGFYDNLTKNEKILIKVHSRDLNESEYINQDILNNIKKNITDKTNDCSILYSDTLFHSKKDLLTELSEKNHLSGKKVKVENKIIKIENNEIFDYVPVLKEVYESDSMIVLSHFKGHSMIGFSGSLKNIATGCTDTDGQIMIHKLAQPFISKIACLACNICADNCPEKVISIDSIARINKELCTGCNVCISSCPKDAIKINKITSESFMSGLNEFANSVLYNKKDNKVLFINMLISIKPYYNCNSNINTVLVNDIGLLASFDPVAIDKASYDLINNNGTIKTILKEKNSDKFKEIWRNIDGTIQFELAEKKGLGTTNYKLIEI